MNNQSEVLSKSLKIVYPFIIIYGAYIVLNGHLSPGGGFQGGAVLASVYICKYLVLPIYDYQLTPFKLLEKILLVFIMCFPLLFIVYGFSLSYPNLNIPYLLVMNGLIALKVACGISLIFFRFVFFETR